MKILFVNPIAQLGGAERSLLDLIGSLRKHDPLLELRLLALSSGPLIEAARDLGIEADELSLPAPLRHLGEHGHLALSVLHSALGAPAAIRYSKQFRAYLRSTLPDVVHTNGFKAHVLAALAIPERIPLVWHLRDFLTRRRLMKRVLPALQGRASAAVAISEAVANDVRPLLDRIPVIALLNGIRTAEFDRSLVRPADLDLLANLEPAPEETVRIGLVATYAHWKGHELFLQAIAPLRYPSVRFYIVGGRVYDTPDSQVRASWLRERLASLELGSRCGLVGFQANAAAVYAALDIVVHASTSPEPFGRTVAEAMASGCAVVASAEGGPAEQITHGKDGLLVPPRDIGALRSALGLLVADATLRRRLADAARIRARTKLDSARLGPPIAVLYRTLVDDELVPAH